MKNPAANPDSLSQELREKLHHYVMPAVADGVSVALRGVEKYGADEMMEDGTDYDDWIDEMVEKNVKEIATFISQEILKELEHIKIMHDQHPLQVDNCAILKSAIEARISFWKGEQK